MDSDSYTFSKDDVILLFKAELPTDGFYRITSVREGNSVTLDRSPETQATES